MHVPVVRTCAAVARPSVAPAKPLYEAVTGVAVEGTQGHRISAMGHHLQTKGLCMRLGEVA